MKRSGSNIDDEAPMEKRQCPETDLLTSLTQVLSEIRSTPSTGEISAEVMETFKVLMLQIEELSSDETNVEGKLIKDETEQCLESWLEDLVAQCEADGELDFYDDDDDAFGELSDDDDLVLALALQQGQDDEDDNGSSQNGSTSDQQRHHGLLSFDDEEVDDDDDEEIIIVDDEDDDVEGTLDTQQIQIMA
ncbi:hypothetical protein BCR42DRAFT_417869 [Absidia repens]|uniref:Uncharacterized protein n=1 Tax=Absidia repens TaxID=90262 RepID=A0A1X2IE19_9FUNG|nr:hypothetical protein BCR42DRAFT_417869 [Absidia repens]